MYSLDAGVIKLNRRQRILLGERLPCRLEDELRQQGWTLVLKKPKNRLLERTKNKPTRRRTDASR